MKCQDCEYNSKCSLQEIAKDITGCEGHSKERVLRDDEVRCRSCYRIVNKSRSFTSDLSKDSICFQCY